MATTMKVARPATANAPAGPRCEDFLDPRLVVRRIGAHWPQVESSSGRPWRGPRCYSGTIVRNSPICDAVTGVPLFSHATRM